MKTLRPAIFSRHGVFPYCDRIDFYRMQTARTRCLTQRSSGLQPGANAPRRVWVCIRSRKTDRRPARQYHREKVSRRHGVGCGCGCGLMSELARGHELIPSGLNLRFSDFGNNVDRSCAENSSGAETLPWGEHPISFIRPQLMDVPRVNVWLVPDKIYTQPMHAPEPRHQSPNRRINQVFTSWVRSA